MKNDFRFSTHAVERIEDRGLGKETIELVLDDPDSILRDSKCKQIYQKVIIGKDSKYLYRVFINICKQPNLVITAYKTSKIGKYEY